jgi:hypothetical protein
VVLAAVARDRVAARYLRVEQVRVWVEAWVEVWVVVWVVVEWVAAEEAAEAWVVEWAEEEVWVAVWVWQGRVWEAEAWEVVGAVSVDSVEWEVGWPALRDRQVKSRP